MRPGCVQKHVVFVREIETPKRSQNEITPVTVGREYPLNVCRVEPDTRILYERGSDRCGKVEEVVRDHLFTHLLQKIGHNPAAAKTIERCFEGDFGQDLGQLWNHPVLRSHKTQPRIRLRSWKRHFMRPNHLKIHVQLQSHASALPSLLL